MAHTSTQHSGNTAASNKEVTMTRTATQARAAAVQAAAVYGTFSAEAYKARQAARLAEASNRPGRKIVWAPR